MCEVEKSRSRSGFALTIAALLVLLHAAPRGSAVPRGTRPVDVRTSTGGSDVEDNEEEETAALEEQLTRVFGVGRIPEHYRHLRRNSDETGQPVGQHHHQHHRRHRSPPEYMVQLYNAVAFSDGISKTAAPYEADVVRGVPDRALAQQVYYLFNLSHIDPTDDILAAELHLFKLRPAPDVRRTLRRSGRRSNHVAQVRLYQVLRDGAGLQPLSSSETSSGDAEDETGLRLIHQRRVSARRHGWQVFRVRNVVRHWISHPQTNFGFLLTATSLDGDQLNGTIVRFAQRSEHHDSKQPVLVVFSEQRSTGDNGYAAASNNNNNNNATDDGEDDVIAEVAVQPPPVTDSNLRAMRRNYIRYLNEAYRAEHGGDGGDTAAGASTSIGHRRPETLYMSPSAHRQLVDATVRSSRERRSAGRRRGRRGNCQRHELYVDFEKIGWAGWIISPKGYNAYQCRGTCSFPLGQNQHPSNHATVQSIVHALGMDSGNGLDRHGGLLVSTVDTPCCVPNKLYSISLLYFDDDENVILKQYDEMVALNCGCH